MIALLTIDAEALRANVAALRAVVAPAAFGAVVKANAYGHGLREVGRALAGSVDTFCVYRLEEALALRNDAGITAPILVLGPVESRDLALAYAADVAITLWDDGGFRRDVRAASRRSPARPFRVHAKLDTGTTRLGIDERHAGARLASYLEDRELALCGIYTHLAAAEELESEFTLEQLARFEAAIAPFEAEIRERRIVRHTAASAAAILFPSARYDLVRAGIACYGIWPSDGTQLAAPPGLVLRPALSWTTELTVVREVEAGTSVGYGCTFVTERRSTIGVLPIGYSEGLPRAASNRGTVLVHGKRAPIIGRVCMNMTFVDLTGIPQAAPNSLVTLIGQSGDDAISANDWGTWCDSIGYEIVSRLPASVPRRVTTLPQTYANASNSPIASARSIVPS